MLVLLFGIGFLAGVVLGVWAGRRGAGKSHFIESQGLENMIDCRIKCGKTYDIGSNEYNDCVQQFLASKTYNPPNLKKR
jgi:hypothetical protein